MRATSSPSNLVLCPSLRHILLMFFRIQKSAMFPFLFATAGAWVVAADLWAGTHLARGSGGRDIEVKVRTAGWCTTIACATSLLRLRHQLKHIIEYPAIEVPPEIFE